MNERLNAEIEQFKQKSWQLDQLKEKLAAKKKAFDEENAELIALVKNTSLEVDSLESSIKLMAVNANGELPEGIKIITRKIVIPSYSKHELIPLTEWAKTHATACLIANVEALKPLIESGIVPDEISRVKRDVKEAQISASLRKALSNA